MLSFYRAALLESEYVVLKEGERKKNLQSVILNYTVIDEYRSTLGRSKVIFSWPHHKKSCQHLNKQRQGDERKTYGFNSWKLYVTWGSSEKKTLKTQGQRSISMLMWEEVMDQMIVEHLGKAGSLLSRLLITSAWLPLSVAENQNHLQTSTLDNLALFNG